MKKVLLIFAAIVVSLLIVAVVLFVIFQSRYTVTYDLNGGVMEVTESHVWYNRYYELPMPTKKGYYFAGWYYNGEYLESAGKWSFKEDRHLVARWEIRDENGFVFDQSESGYVIKGYKGVAKEKIVVPQSYNGMPVIGINENSFYGLKQIANDLMFIFLPKINGVNYEPFVSDGKMVFSQYTYIDEKNLIYLEDGETAALVGYTGDYSKSITVPLTANGKTVTSVGAYTFYNGVNKIDHNSSTFFRIMISENIVKIGENAFGNCGGIKLCLYYVTENKEVREITDSARIYDWLLQAEVEENNGDFDQVICLIKPAFGWSAYSHATIYVRFDTDGGVIISDGKTVTDKELVNRSKYSLPVPTKEGFSFVGWYLEDTEVPTEGERWAYSKFITLVARWIEE